MENFQGMRGPVEQKFRLSHVWLRLACPEVPNLISQLKLVCLNLHVCEHANSSKTWIVLNLVIVYVCSRYSRAQALYSRIEFERMIYIRS